MVYGDPQGSCLGSLLFLCVNDIALASNCDTILFADDTCVMKADKNLEKLETRVTVELEQINS